MTQGLRRGNPSRRVRVSPESCPLERRRVVHHSDMKEHELASPEALLGRLDRVRALARRLVRNAADEDDLVQDALVAALRRPASVQGDPLGWVARVVRNRARDRSRADRRRARREGQVARPEHTVDTTRAVELAERQTEVVGAVLRLEEPLRSVILLAYFEELPLREVARRTGQQIEAVKKQHQRALARLREDFERRWGREGQWAVLLLPLTGPRVTRWGSLRSVSATLAALSAAVVVCLGIAASRGQGEDVTDAELPRRPAPNPLSSRTAPSEPDAALVPLSVDREQQRTSAIGEAPTIQDPPPRTVEATSAPAQAPPEWIPEVEHIPAGPALIGSTRAEVGALLAESNNTKFQRVLDAQTPAHSVSVPEFWLGKYEVTNRQYLAFVDETRRCPPISWANAEAAQRAAPAFSERKLWWAEHWQEAGYAIPAGEAEHPVVYVTHADAEAFCAWVGMRLPTEFEFQRAARGDSNREFPWGDAWVDGQYANTAELRLAKATAVGAFEAGRSRFGLYDMAGNVWEWTSSPYVAFPGFDASAYSVLVNEQSAGRSAEPLWNPSQRVVVGGSFQEPRLAVRIATRRAADPTQATNALGFRVATSVRPKRP